MTDNTENTGDDLKFDELAMLKQRADLLNVAYSNNIGPEKLKERIAEKLAQDEAKATGPEDKPEPEAETVPEATAPVAKTDRKMSLFEYMKLEHLKLVRLRIANNNPQKSNLPGEIHTVANKYVGTVRKFIPYDDKSEDGWHVPYIMYKHLEDRQFLMIRETKNRKGEIEVIRKMVKEFTLEILDPLTPQEVAKLAQAQAALTE